MFVQQSVFLAKQRRSPEPTDLCAACKQSSTGSAVESNKQALFLAIELAAVDVSIVDHIPEELLLITATGLHLELADGIGPENSFTSRRLSIDSIEIDDQVATSRFPVLLTTAAIENEEGGVAQPLLQFSMVCQPGGVQGQVTLYHVIHQASPPRCLLIQQYILTMDQVLTRHRCCRWTKCLAVHPWVPLTSSECR